MMLYGGSHENGPRLSSLEIDYITILSLCPRGLVRYAALTAISPPLWDCDCFSFIYLFMHFCIPLKSKSKQRRRVMIMAWMMMAQELALAALEALKMHSISVPYWLLGNIRNFIYLFLSFDIVHANLPYFLDHLSSSNTHL